MSQDEHEGPPTTGLIAQKYELVRMIGRGGMGAVWEGRHATLGTRVAIKFIDAEYTDSQEARARFDNEARAAATIQSKHAIQIYDHGVTQDGKPYIVMELLVGEPLDRRIERAGRLPLQETARILRQVARALQRAHELGIVHRDLKPENIFLVRTPDDDDEIAKVLDFGIAKFKKMDGSPGGVTSSTKTGAVLGTPFFMSPEQARGLREIDHRSDLWSMGIIAFKCVTGVLPFEGVSVGDLLVKVCTSPAPIPSRVVPGLPITFDNWFMRALEKEPARRFQSALELSEALAYAAGVSVKARAVSHLPSNENPNSTPGHQAMSGSGGAPGVTSAPFTSPTPSGVQGVPPSSKGIIAAAIGATIIGIALGVVAIVKFTSKPMPQQAITVVTAPQPDPPPSAVVLPLATANAAVDAGLEVPVTPLPDVHHHHGTKPAATPSAAPSGTPPAPSVAPVPAPSTTAPPAPTTPPAPHPTAKPAPTATAIDPGY